MSTQLLLAHRILFLSEEITTERANALVASLLLLDADDPGRQIDLYINSPGGSVRDGLAIIDAMHCIEAPVSTLCIGTAASMAAWVLAAGEPGCRFATPHAEVMIHQVMGGYRGTADDVRIYADRILRDQRHMVEELSRYTGQTIERIQQDTSRDCFMTPEEAQEYGLIDHIITPRESSASRIHTR